MRRRKIGDRTLSPRIPESVRQTKIAADDLCEGLEEFSREHLKGALTFTCEGSRDGYITVCSYQCAYAIRQAVEYGAPDKPVQLTLRMTDDTLFLHIVIKEDTEIEALAGIARALRRAGFSVTAYSYGVKAQTKLECDKLLKVYEKSRRTFLQDLHTIFFA